MVIYKKQKLLASLLHEATLLASITEITNYTGITRPTLTKIKNKESINEAMENSFVYSITKFLSEKERTLEKIKKILKKIEEDAQEIK